MKQVARYAMVLILLSGIISLAGNSAVGARGAAKESNQTTPAQIQGYVWDDLDRDGVQDADESGIPDVAVNLYDSKNALVDTVNTDAGGQYLFRDLAPGKYHVQVLPPDGYVFSPRDRGRDETLDSDAHTVTGKTSVIKLVAGETQQIWDAGLHPWDFRHKSNPGTVKPPPSDIEVCQDGNYSVGGVAGVKVHELERGYCLAAFLRNHAFALGRIPDGAGKVLAQITFLRIFDHGRFVYKLPPGDGDIQICYAVPDGKEAQIYFFDFYGPRFGERNKQPAWQPLETTVKNGIACAAAQTSGAYALIGQ